MGGEEEKIIGGEHAGKWEKAEPLKLSLKVSKGRGVQGHDEGLTVGDVKGAQRQNQRDLLGNLCTRAGMRCRVIIGVKNRRLEETKEEFEDLKVWASRGTRHSFVKL